MNAVVIVKKWLQQFIKAFPKAIECKPIKEVWRREKNVMDECEVSSSVMICAVWEEEEEEEEEVVWEKGLGQG